MQNVSTGYFYNFNYWLHLTVGVQGQVLASGHCR